MSGEWYYVKGDEKVGPLDDDEMGVLMAMGKITWETLVWTFGMEDWKPFAETPQALALKPSRLDREALARVIKAGTPGPEPIDHAQPESRIEPDIATWEYPADPTRPDNKSGYYDTIILLSLSVATLAILVKIMISNPGSHIPDAAETLHLSLYGYVPSIIIFYAIYRAFAFSPKIGALLTAIAIVGIGLLLSSINGWIVLFIIISSICAIPPIALFLIWKLFTYFRKRRRSGKTTGTSGS